MRVRLIAGKPRHVGGWRPSRPRLGSPALPVAKMAAGDAAEVDWGVPVFDQKRVGDCVANASCALLAQLEHTAKTPKVFSRYFLYALARQREGVALGIDSGLMPEDAMLTLAEDGCCLESEWPSGDPDGWTADPSEAARQAAKKHADAFFFGAASLETALQSIIDGFAFSFGFTVYPSFMSDEVARTGEIPMPGDSEEPDGGHDVVAVAFDRNRKVGDTVGFIKLVNSWSEDWALGGFAWLPMDYFRKGIATDMKTVRRMPL